MIIVDTNVVSELMKPSPHRAVHAWATRQPARDLYTTAITVAEVLYGIERLPPGRKQAIICATATEVFATFADRVLGFDAAAATEYSMIVSSRDRLGQPIDGFDAQIAAICRAHGSTLATRNTKDFRHLDLELIDPWLAPAQTPN